MPLLLAQPYPDPTRMVFFDDFHGLNYNNRIWAVTGTGGVDTLATVTGGRIRVSATASNTYIMHHGNVGAFSVASQSGVEWVGKPERPARGKGGYAECGLMSTQYTTSFMCWRATRSVTNYQCIASLSGTATTVDSGVAVDSSDHVFRIECRFTANPGYVYFYLDGVLRATVNSDTYISYDPLQPHLRCAGSTSTGAANAYFQACSVLAQGVRQ